MKLWEDVKLDYMNAYRRTDRPTDRQADRQEGRYPKILAVGWALHFGSGAEDERVAGSCFAKE